MMHTLIYKNLETPSKGSLSGIDILLVEDELKLSRMYVKFLTYLGARVRIAFDGIQGIERLEVGYPDIVILDLMMPRMNGYDMLKEVRHRNLAKGVPVIILTNLKDRPEDVEKIQKLGVSDYLIKSDTHLHELFLKIKKHANRV